LCQRDILCACGNDWQELYKTHDPGQVTFVLKRYFPQSAPKRKKLTGKDRFSGIICGVVMITEDFESFLEANEKRIYHYLYNILGVEADAQDVLQDSFIAFYEHLDSIEKSTAVSYIYRIAHNKAMNFIKLRKHYLFQPPENFHNLPDNTKQSIEPDFNDLRLAIRELPVKLAAIIHLQYYEKLSYKAMAEQLGISVKAVESLAVRAKRILRKKIMQDSK
ncbi:MAG: sigma-70 family RNA polymerase sigma factor, partial [Candidatus Cloacimonadaceae bacterium]|nr:sigma-70 family RNA polymerase sigma factor [Candidatus Cloacimonadaceae bacterium]